ncbi:MAG: hypothetical protein KY466_14775 [Gemmatimonadetes bacterium]|nr:hypothetical protein [Gemmatimonadota bacterium]
MDVRRAYCSAVDHMVPVVLKAGAPADDHVSLRDPSDLVCLDYKVRCTGWCCPLFSVDDEGDAGLAASDTVVTTTAAAPSRKPGTKSRWTRPT